MLTQLLIDLFTDYTLRTVALGAATLGTVGGALGVFAVLRRQSMLGDAMSHAALPGVVLAFMLTGLKTPIVLMVGAALAGLVGILVMLVINRYTRIKEDSSLGIILSVFFGFGLLLLTFLQRNPDARQAGLNKFLFGQAATLLTEDVITMVLFGGLALLLMLLFWKEFKLLSFDRDFGASVGFPMSWLEVLITGLLVIAIVIGLQAVGVVLMSAMVVAPAAAARQWTDRLGVMVTLAAAFGALAGVVGTVISGLGEGLSTGPVIVLCISVIVVVSLLFAPNRGLLWNWLAQQRNRRQLQTEQVLSNLYHMAAQHADPTHPHSVTVLRVMGTPASALVTSLTTLAERGLVRRVAGDRWALTTAGVQAARRRLAGVQEAEA
jgi:manganese/zinc/iron transport system permease protein